MPVAAWACPALAGFCCSPRSPNLDLMRVPDLYSGTWVAFGGEARRPGERQPWRSRLPMLAAALPGQHSDAVGCTREWRYGRNLQMLGGMVASLLCGGIAGVGHSGPGGASLVLVAPWSATAVAPPGS